MKSHSRGEYVFDRGWAEAYERAGGNYYPKLQVAVPFTPATGRVSWSGRARMPRRSRGALAAGLVEIMPAARASPASCDFPYRARMAPARRARLSAAHRPAVPLGQRRLCAASTIFLAALASRKRKAIRRERQEALANGIEVALAHRLRPDRGRCGTPSSLLHGHRLAQMGPALSDARVLLLGRREHARPHPAGDGQARRPLDRRRHQFHRRATPSSAATGAPSSTTRSCISSSATIRLSISPSRTSFARVEAGAQGEHKLSRGYMPTTTYSAHFIADPALRRAIADYLVRERAYVKAAG